MCVIAMIMVPSFVLAQELDTDKDRLTDVLEAKFGSDPTVSDTDNDGYDDFSEVMSGHSPTSSDPDITFERKLIADLSHQRMYYHVGNARILNMPISTGNPGTPTPVGTYTIMRMIPNMRYTGVGYDLPNVLWNMEFKQGGYFIHGAYWHNDFGKRTHSHGCINLRNNHAEFLYHYMEPGVTLVVEGETPKARTVGT